MSLDPIGTFSYGDGTVDGTYVFPANTEITDYTITPIRDESGRTIAYEQITIGVRWIVNQTAEDDDSIDATIDTIREQLRPYAGVLRFESAGLGTLNVNGDDDDDAILDVKWGPKPGRLNVRPLGGARAAELSWSLSVCTVLCSDGLTDASQPMELTYKLRYHRDESGYTTRTLRFHVSIAQTRLSPDDRVPIDTVDDWYERVLPILLPGFRRSYGPVEISADGCTMEFDVTDTEEGPNYLPPGVVRASVKHNIQNMTQTKGFRMWSSTITGSYEMARDQPAGNAWAAFLAIVKKRILLTLQTMARGGNNTLATFSNATAANFGMILPLHLSFEEDDVYGRQKSNFQFTYMLVNQRIQDILTASSLWTPVDDTWDAWSASLKNTALAPRGNAGLRDFAADRIILDLCVVGNTGPIGGTTTITPAPMGQLQSILGSAPSPDASWILYENRLVTEDHQSVMVTTPIPTTPLTADPDNSGFSQPTGSDDNDGFDPSPYANEPDSNIQTRGGGQYYVWLRGKALRAVYNIDPPSISRIGNATATPANRADHGEGFSTWVHGTFGWPIMAANWNLRFLLTEAPTTVMPPSTPTNFGNSELHTDGSLVPDLFDPDDDDDGLW